MLATINRAFVLHLRLFVYAHCPDHFRVAFMADENDMSAFFKLPLGLAVDFGYKRTGCIDIDHIAPRGFGGNRFGDPVGAEHDRLVVGDLVQFFDKNRALRLKAFDDIFVVDDFVPHIDRCTIAFERLFHDLDCAVDPGAKPARGRDQQV